MRGLLSRWKLAQLRYPEFDDEPTTGSEVSSSITEARDLLGLGEQIGDRVVDEVPHGWSTVTGPKLGRSHKGNEPEHSGSRNVGRHTPRLDDRLESGHGLAGERELNTCACR
jgi:hypothetical protein